MKTKTFSTALASLLLIVATAAGAAADKPRKEGAFGKGGGPYLTKEQLRSCLNQKAHNAQLEDELSKEQAALAGVKADIVRDGDALKAKLEVLDRTNAEAVAAYNEESQARDKQIDAFQARAAAFNTRVESMQGERDAYAKACENRRYFEDDEIAIKKGK